MKSIMPSGISGEIDAPPSKSITGRAVAAALLAKGTTTVLNPSLCDDGLVAMGIAETLGACVRKGTGQVEITSEGIFKNRPRGNMLNCGESGLCMRMFAPIVALHDEQFVLDGCGSLLRRPVHMLEDLSQLGVLCKTAAGLPPVKVQGPIKEAKIRIDASESSQFLTGLLMALPLTSHCSLINVSDIRSRAYVAMTISLLRDFGVKISHKNFRAFKIRGNQKYIPCTYPVEGDWSGAAFMLVGGAIAGKVKVKNLDMHSHQADRKILDVFRKVGAKIKIAGNSVSVEKYKLKAFEFDAAECPDLFPPLVALAASCNGATKIKGAGRLRHKESDRAQALASEFAKMGVKIKVEGDEMRITGGRIKSAEVHSHNDHRMAMACAIAALNADGEVKIRNAGCVSKSYPGFFRDLEGLMK